MAANQSGDAITQYLASLFLFAGTWIASNHVLDAFGVELGLYTWFVTTLLAAFLVSVGAFALYFRLKTTVGARLGGLP